MNTLQRYIDWLGGHAHAVVPGLRAIRLWRWRRLAVIAVAFWVPVLIFVAIADEVLERDRIAADYAVLDFLRSIGSPTLDAIVASLTDLGGAVGVSVLMTALLALLFIHRRFRGAVFAVAAIGGAVAINLLMKGIFQRDRPDVWESIIVETSFSFPSGHAMASAALALTVALLAWRYGLRYKIAIAVAAAVYAVFIGLSRNYLGVHFPSDVVGGWCISAAWVIVVYLAMYGRPLKLEKR